MVASPPPPDPTAWADLEALAAGELDPARAEALQRRIEADAGLREAYARVRRVEQALRGEPAYDLPPRLAARILDGLAPPDRLVSLPALARLAAAVLLVLGAWIAASGSAPTLASAEPPPAVRDALSPVLDVLPSAELPSLAGFDVLPEDDGLSPLVLAGGGLLLLLLGLLLARKVARGATAGPPSPPLREQR